MTDLVVVETEGPVPSVEALARRIAPSAEPDGVALLIAEAVHSRLVAQRAKDERRPCLTCRHRVSDHVSDKYDAMCVNPLIAKISYRRHSDVTTIDHVYCSTERQDPYPEEVRLCGPSGMLHQPIAVAGLLVRTRSWLRRKRLGMPIVSRRGR